MKIPDFDSLWSEVHSIQYGFTREEASALFERCSCAPTGLAVEVGSMQGGSARVIEATGRPVVCVDPIENPEYYAMFVANTKEHMIAHIRAKDYMLWPDWNYMIAVLLIDHDHKYDSTLSSLLNWRRHVRSDGVVFVHDYGGEDWPDVKPATDASGLKIDGVVGRLAWGHWW